VLVESSLDPKKWKEEGEYEYAGYHYGGKAESEEQHIESGSCLRDRPMQTRKKTV
jgi:hypothetical protein